MIKSNVKKRLKILSVLCLIFVIIFVNVTKVFASGLGDEAGWNKKEYQLIKKIHAIKNIFGSSVDEYALYATLVHRGTLTDYVKESYDKNFDESEYKDIWTSFQDDVAKITSGVTENLALVLEGIGAVGTCAVNGTLDQDCVLEETINAYSKRLSESSGGVVGDSTIASAIKKPQSIDLLVAATVVMLDSSGWTGKYSDENYKQALAGEQFVGNMFDKNSALQNVASIAMNSLMCTVGVGVLDFGLSTFEPTTDLLGAEFGSAQNQVAGKLSRFYTMSNICEKGFIGGTYDSVKNYNTESDAAKERYQKKKDVIAEEIIEIAEKYRERYGAEDNLCSVAGSITTSEITNWRQCDDAWGSITLGSGGVSVCKWGCTTTSISYIIAKSGTALSVQSFNPGVYAKTQSAYSGSLIAWNHSGVAPNAHDLGARTDMNTGNYVSKIESIISTAYNGKQQYVVIELKKNGGTHWVAVDHVENGQVYVLDPSAKSGIGLVKIEDAWRWGGTIGDYHIIYFDDVEFGSSSSSTGTANVKVNKYLSAMKKIADDDSHGYSMDNRNGPDYDCSSFIYYSLINSNAFDFSGNSPFVTSTMGAVLKTLGFTEISYSKSKLQRGDIVVDPREGANGHVTTIYSVDGSNIKQIAAHSNKDGKTGDSSGEEINVSDYTEGHHQYKYIYRLVGATDDECDTDTTVTDEQFLEFIAYVEGVSYCNYRGQGANTGYKAANEGDGAGMTTAFGITQNYNADIAREVGYSSFNSDMNSGCVSKEYIDKMFPTVIANHKSSVESDLSSKGVTSITESQKLALISIQYNTGSTGGYANIVDKIAKYGANSFEVFKCLSTKPCSWKADDRFKDGLVRRRMAEYELYMTGNYNAAKPTETYSYFSGFTKSDLENYKKRWPTSR